MNLIYKQTCSVIFTDITKTSSLPHSRFLHFSTLQLHFVSHIKSLPLQSHFLVAHFPLQAHGFLVDSLSLFVGKAGLLNRDFRLATTCSFDGRSFPSRYCSTSDLGSTGSTLLTWTLAFFSVLYLLLS